MTLSEEIIFLVKLREKCEKYCSATNVAASYKAEVELLSENKLISARAVAAVADIYE